MSLNITSAEIDKKVYGKGVAEWTMYESKTKGSTYPEYGHYLKLKKLIDLDDRYDVVVKEYSELSKLIHSKVADDQLPYAVMICEDCRTILPLPTDLIDTEDDA